ncbi:MAG: glycosyltransferase [Campylobacterota bacterium]|nr:glycosyltransferase [Campylobacterota bacterium]
MKIAIIHDWLVTNAGAEKVLRAILEVYPDADIFSIVDFLSGKERNEVLIGKQTTTSFIQHLPSARKHFRNYLPLFPKAIESFDLSAYDLIISSSWAFAKGVKTGKHQIHICYCHTPIRYAWDLYDEYTSDLKQPKKFLVQQVLKSIRKWDLETSKNVTNYIANSTLVQDRIRKTYGRNSTVVHPPVDTSAFTLNDQKENFYFTASRLVPYKKIKLIVEAFNLSGKPLVVAGSGEELKEIKSIAKSNITVLGYVDDETMRSHMQRARAFVFAALEDFGIIPVEAMACGTPVIAYGKGGILDTVIDEKTGVFFDQQNTESINKAVEKFETLSFDHQAISRHAQKFSTQVFKTKLKKYIDECLTHTGI